MTFKKTNYLGSSNDFRSDTFTTPTKEIRLAALESSIGDDVYDEDDDTNLLEHTVAELTGKEAGLFCVSGTLANQIAIRTHLHQPPYSIICDYRSHIFVHEAAGLAILSNAIVIPIKPSNGLYLTVEDIEDYLVPTDGDIHGAPTKLISLENTLHGVIFPYTELLRIKAFTRENNLKLHCDGARLWNASVESGVSLKQYGEIFDSISLCLSKSIGAPIGSVLVGDQDYISTANHFKKQNGGGIRQAGVITSMALAALKQNYINDKSVLKRTHQKAKEFSNFLLSNGIELSEPTDTNFVFIHPKKSPIDTNILEEKASKYNVKLWLRITFHYQISDESIENAKKAILEAYHETQILLKQDKNKKISNRVY